MAEKLAHPPEEEKQPKLTFVKPPQPKAPPPPSKIQTLRRLLGYVTAYRGKLAAVIILLLVSTLLNVVGPYLLGVGINEYLEQGTVAGLINVVLLMGAAGVGGWVAGMVQGWLMADIAQSAMYALRRDLFDHIQTLSLRFYDRQPIGELMSRVVNDTDAINQFLSNGITRFLQSTFTLLGVVVAMLLLSIPMSIAVLVVVPLMAGALALFGRYAGAAFANLQESLGALNGYMEETISGARVIKAYRQEESAVENFRELSLAARKADGRANFLALLMNPVTTFLSNLDVAIVAMAGGWLAVRGAMQVGTVATFLNYARQFNRPLSQLSQLFNTILQAIAGAERVFEILDEQPEIVDRPDALALLDVEGHVVFDQVDFSYVPGIQILYDNSFEAQPGQMIGLCGPTGAGKSTIINVLTRFYDIQDGAITVDGQSIYEVQQDSLRRRTGIVLQVPFLFSETVMENLRYGRLDASDEECVEAAKLANAHEFIERLPDGYQTVLSERGSNLSQGQRQLLTIARAILAEPDVLILDEATSSVDTRTEKKIQEALLRLMEGRTSFVIAHRLSTIRGADQIIVLDHGKIVDLGAHDTLMAREGFYYDLYMSQFKEELRQGAGRVSE
jgi:ATP-binding cassette subfamily B protein